MSIATTTVSKLNNNFTHEEWKKQRASKEVSHERPTHEEWLQQRGEVQSSEPIQNDRGVIDRVLGTLGNTGVVEGLYNLTDDDEESTFFSGLGEGLSYQNPFTDDVSGRHTFSDVLKNIGWEDKDPDKLSFSDVGRGVVGFVGDVFLDPLTYLNPFSAAAKVVKGTGMAVDTAKKLETITKSIGDARGNTASAVDKIDKLRGLGREDAKKIIDNYNSANHIIMDEATLTAKADELLNNYASKIQKIRNVDEGNGLSLGLGKFKKELVSSKSLRELGDRTIAPYYNNLAIKLRTSALGKRFSTKNEIEALGKVNGEAALAKFYTDDLLRGFSRTAEDLKDMADADVIKDYWEGLTEEQQNEFYQLYRTGYINDVLEFRGIRAAIVEAAEKAAKEVPAEEQLSFLTPRGATKDEEISNSVSFLFERRAGQSATKVQNSLKKDRAALAELKRGLSDYMNSVGKEFSASKYRKLQTAFGKSPRFMDDSTLRSAAKLDYLTSNGATYKEIMDNYNGIDSTLNDIAHKADTEDLAFRQFFHLSEEEKRRVVDFAYDTLGPTIEARPTIVPPASKVIERFDNAVSRAESDIDYRLSLDGKPPRVPLSYYAKIEQLFGTDFVDSLGKTAHELERIISAGTNSTLDDKTLEIADLIRNRMKEAADKEVELGLLSPDQAAAMEGKYILQTTSDDLKELMKTVYEEKNGAYNPDVLGIAKAFNKSRSGEYNLGDNEMLENGTKILNDVLHEIYLARSLGSNKLVYSTEVQNFIKKQFGKELVTGKVPDKGYAIVLPFKDLEKAFLNARDDMYKEMYADLMDDLDGLFSVDGYEPKLLNDFFQTDLRQEVFTETGTVGEVEGLKAKYLERLKKLLKEREEEIYSNFDKVIRDTYFSANPGSKDLYTPNVSFQVLNDKQRKFVEAQCRTPVLQMDTNILDRTNVLSRTQKLELESKFMQLFDRFQQLWKVNNTVVTPAFHAQNALSNAFQSFLGVSEDALNVKKVKKAFDIIRTKDPKQTVTLAGKTYTYRDMDYLAKKSGVIDEMFHEFELRGDDKGMIKGLPAELDPTNLEEFKVYKWGTAVGTQLEGAQRLNLFMSALDKGMAPQEAAEYVNKFLFDYSDLTNFEQDVMKRIIPFYTFMRKNIPMELEMMIERPEIFRNVNKALTEVEQMGDYRGENERSEWTQEHYQVPGLGYGINPQLPYQQLEKLEPNEDGVFNKIIGSTDPLIKAAYEIPTGEYAYTGIDIESPLGYLLGQTAPTSIAKNAFHKYESTGDAGEAAVYGLSRFFGFPMNKIE